MRTENGGYRFTIQFPGKTDEQRYVGEYLERLGSKKGGLIVLALSEYLSQHSESGKIFAFSFSRNDLKDAIRDVLSERGLVIQLSDEPQPAESGGSGLDGMLDSLNAFG